MAWEVDSKDQGTTGFLYHSKMVQDIIGVNMTFKTIRFQRIS